MLTPTLPILPPETPARSTIIHSEELFAPEQQPEHSMPTFTREELLDLGIELTETEQSRSVVIPLIAQKKLAESVKSFGFGSANALHVLIEHTLHVLGFTGPAKFAVQEKTFAWNAWQSKLPPKPEPAATPPAPGGVLSAAELATFSTGAVRDKNVAGSKTAEFPARYDLVSPIGLRRIAETYGEGALKYDDHNWRKGMPISTCLNHCLAHINAYMMGDETEDHMAHAAWNLFAVMHFDETNPELFDLKIDDYPQYAEVETNE